MRSKEAQIITNFMSKVDTKICLDYHRQKAVEYQEYYQLSKKAFYTLFDRLDKLYIRVDKERRVEL